MGKNSPVDAGLIPGGEGSLEEEIATHSSNFIWKNPMDRGP